jgi:hypothetical protein
VHAGDTLAQRVGQFERGIAHAEGFEDATLEHLAEPLASDRLECGRA